MTEKQTERTPKDCSLQDATVRQTQEDPSMGDSKMSHEYAKLKALLPDPTRTRTDISKADIVEEAAQYIEELQSRVTVSYPSPADAANARMFLLQRVTKDFKAAGQDL